MHEDDDERELDHIERLEPSVNDPASFRENCPYCGKICECDLVHNGVGLVQCGPFHCASCGASEIGGADESRSLTDEERRTGWYGPGAKPGSSANVIGGRIVGYQEMEAAYRGAFQGNSLWGGPGRVSEWFERVRREGVSE